MVNNIFTGTNIEKKSTQTKFTRYKYIYTVDKYGLKDSDGDLKI